MNLFDYAYEKSGCLVMSDLPYKVEEDDVKEIFAEVNINEYTLEQWNDVLHYILEKRNFTGMQSMDEVKTFLRNKNYSVARVV